MRAARFYNKSDIRIDDIPIPTPKENQVLISVEWCGICGSDLHEYEHGPLTIPHSTPHAISGEVLPVTLGHEFCGRVSQVGEGCKKESEGGLKVGDAVMVDPRLFCRACGLCEGGASNGCASWGFRGLSGGGGGLSEFVAVDEDSECPVHIFIKVSC